MRKSLKSNFTFRVCCLYRKKAHLNQFNPVEKDFSCVCETNKPTRENSENSKACSHVWPRKFASIYLGEEI